LNVVSSTPDATFCDEVASRPRETLTFVGNPEPSPAKPGRAAPMQTLWNERLVYAKRMFFKMPFKKLCLVYAKRALQKPSVASSTRNDRFFSHTAVSCTRNVHFGRQTRAEPGQAELSRANPSQARIDNVKKLASRAREITFFLTSYFEPWHVFAHRASRARETLTFARNVYPSRTKHPLLK
jgi:hypothetical protein